MKNKCTNFHNHFNVILSILIIILTVDNFNFHKSISQKVSDINSDLEIQKENLTQIKQYASDLNIEQSYLKADSFKIENLQQSINNINKKIDGFVCILKVDRKGSILECSGSVIDVVGYTSNELKNKDIGIFMTKQLRLVHNTRLYSKFDTKILCDRPITIIGKDNKKTSVEISIITAGENYIVTLKRF